MASRWQRVRSWLTDEPGTADLSRLEPVVARAGDLATGLAGVADGGLAARLDDLPADFADSDAGLAEFLAVLREFAERSVGLRPFDVQLRAAAAMLRGTSVELATGEGKTLVGAIAAVGLVRAGRRVHVLSANDYLAERDAGWMGPLLTAAGASVGWVASRRPHADRVEAYRADVVYVPVSEAGFDLLRDRVRFDVADLVGIRPDAAILDEADAVLLDEARVPLVLAGEAAAAGGGDRELAEFATSLAEGVHFEVDADRRAVHLTEAGLQAVELWRPGVDLFGADHELLTRVNVALHAEVLLTRDVDYVIADGRVRLVSASRGRVEALQRWPEGLQEAVEAKEALSPSASVEVLDQLLVRDLVGLYSSVVGMSATLVPAAEELVELYDLRCGPLPPNRPCIRIDDPDRLFETTADRDAAAVAYVADVHDAGQPVLVATQSIAESERFAGLLTDRGLAPVVLNAKNDAEEAGIIALAGTVGRITVSTQMAGRGTDIRLGEGAAALGGLSIVGLARFPSARLDGQLRGRAGRQGDPGRSVFFTSLGDDLVTEHLPDHRLPVRVLDDGTVTDRRLQDIVDRAQRMSDEQQRKLRDLSRRYGSLPALQRSELLELRDAVLSGDRGVAELARRIPDRLETLRRQVSEAELGQAARTAVLSSLDRRWSEHLAYGLELREGIHLRALARLEPLAEYNRLLVASSRTLAEDALDEAAGLVADAEVVGDRLELDETGVYRPGATWTYMVTDDHFGSEWSRIGRFIAREVLGRA
ncbi:accessory Sec system translocase SecA2 [Propionicicella superfundia]|uniref:accessory Sec system translocase SecA2 n=1 Tax=Propionicicella superfundia TaxID=348582 RepID=UPI0004229E04|nr:accessory Sec system translocase SecA2 [Propionicicella superfundia]